MTPNRPPALPRQVSLMRIIAHGLIAPTSAPTPVEAVRRQLAIQGQQPSAVPHAILSRVPETVTAADVEAAFDDGQLVRSWPMRGTVHITTAADHHWVREALMHRTHGDDLSGPNDRQLTVRDLETAARIACDLIASGGPQPRTAVTDAWSQAGLLEAPGRSDQLVAMRRRYLLVRLHRDGVLVQGPRRAGGFLLVDARGLPDSTQGPGGPGGGAHGTDGHRAALAEIARRFATSHGPASAADLSRWTTLPVRECVQALEDALDSSLAAGADVVPLARALPQGGLRGDLQLLAPGQVVAARERSGVLYLRADLPDLLTQYRKDAERTLFLASFDELHVGYKDRTCLTDEAGERLICPARNGMFRPLLVDRGRVVAVRPAGDALSWAGDARRSARLERDVERAVGRMSARLG